MSKTIYVAAKQPCRPCSKDRHGRCYREWSHGGVEVFICPCGCERAVARRASTTLPQPASS